jgi:hypothetical protein
MWIGPSVGVLPVTDACSLVILISRIELASNDEKMQSIWTKVGKGALPSSSHYETRNSDGGKKLMIAVALYLLTTIQKKFLKSKRNIFLIYDFPPTVASLLIYLSHTMKM